VRRRLATQKLNKMLVEQAAADPRPIPPLVEREVGRMKSNGNCRAALNDTAVRAWAERSLRIRRTLGEITAGAAQPEIPPVHVSWSDAQAYCEWSGYRLPAEAEWELTARGGLDRKPIPGATISPPGGRHMCNIWQGTFPDTDLGEDGFTNVAPARSFPPNGFGLFNMVGNTWEWCADFFDPFSEDASTDPLGPSAGAARVRRADPTYATNPIAAAIATPRVPGPIPALPPATSASAWYAMFSSAGGPHNLLDSHAFAPP
jgi:formylglycine-generating enzyme required for sulfatase activity